MLIPPRPQGNKMGACAYCEGPKHCLYGFEVYLRYLYQSYTRNLGP